MKSATLNQPESPSHNALVNHVVNSHSNSRKDEIRSYTGNGRNSIEVDSCSEINKFSGEVNRGSTHEMNDLMSCERSQIQRAISEAINEQVLPQIQATLKSGQGLVPRSGREVSGRRPDCRSEEALSRKIRSSLRDEFPRNFKKKRRPREYSLQLFLPGPSFSS